MMRSVLTAVLLACAACGGAASSEPGSEWTCTEHVDAPACENGLGAQTECSRVTEAGQEFVSCCASQCPDH